MMIKALQNAGRKEHIMDFTFISQMFIPIVLAACLVIGYIVKHLLPTNNKWIPLILAVSGAVLGCWSNANIELTSVVYGAVTGLASTGMYEAFTQFIESKNSYNSGDDSKGFSSETAAADINNATSAAAVENEEAIDAEAGDSDVN